jgi:hypothetical protein
MSGSSREAAERAGADIFHGLIYLRAALIGPVLTLLLVILILLNFR